MAQKLSLKFTLLLIICHSCTVTDVFGSHFVSFENLNFSFEDKVHRVKSGQSGNIFVWNPSYVDQEERERAESPSIEEEKEKSKKGKGHKKGAHVPESLQRFDMNQIHKELKEEEIEIRKELGSESTNNVVVAAFTIILNKGKYFYSLTYTLSADIETKATGRTTKALGFISGTEGREKEHYVDARQYSLSQLFKDSMHRVKRNIFNDLAPCIEAICIIQEEKKQLAINILTRKDVRDVIDMEEQLRNFDKHIEDGDSVHKKNGGYGPIADSEQFLLSYLEHNLIQFDEEFLKYSGLFINWLDLFTEEQYTYLKKKFSIYDYKDEKKAERKFIKGTEAAKTVASYSIVGSFLNLYSTRELCQFCATSLVDAFYTEGEGFTIRLKNAMKEKSDPHTFPFFVVCASYSDLVSEESHKLRPRGTVSSKLFREPQSYEIIEKEEKIMNLPSVINGQILPLLNLVGNQL